MRFTTTDSFHMNPSSPSSNPAHTAATRQMALSHLPVMFFSSSIPSMSMLLPRETSSASRPHAMAPENACPTETRQAMFPNGSSVVQSQL